MFSSVSNANRQRAALPVAGPGKTADLRHLFAAMLLVLSLTGNVSPAADRAVDFQKQIAPIFAEHCLRCHAPGNDKGDVSLATVEDLMELEYIVPGDPDSSYLIELIRPSDGEAEMPQEADPLSDKQLSLIRQWIAEGARWPPEVVVRQKPKADASWWSLQPLEVAFRSAETTVSMDDPSGKAASSSTTFAGGHSTEEVVSAERNTTLTIDDFVRAKLAEHDLELNPPADRRTLIRRATYDLVGLPPSPQEVDAFVNDPDPAAYEKLVERLLASPHYGERWGRHWLDVVRFGESIGYERNVIIDNLWPFRDYVIRCFNQDKPLDQFIREHLAGDIFGKDDPHVAVGSAFLVSGPYDDVGNQDPAQASQIRANTLDEIIRATGEAFLGMTLGCARCHDHKFDPVTQQDYYGLYATFAGIRHGSAQLATPQARAERNQGLKPLNQRKAALEKARQDLTARVLQRARERLADYEVQWTRPPVDRTGTEERFERVTAKFVRLVCEAQDINPKTASGFRIDELEVWSSGEDPRNVALAARGGKATGKARQIEDFPDAYGPQHAIDGKAGARFISTADDLTIELATPTLIDRVVFSSARGAKTPEHRKFVFVAEYRIEVSNDGQMWREVASGRDRQPVNRNVHLDHRLLRLEMSDSDRAEQKRLTQELASVARQIAKVPTLPSVWIGKRVAADAKGPFHVFLGGSPQKKGQQVVPASLSAFDQIVPAYRLEGETDEATRRQALADWITHADNPLPPRVLANRLWHYHFGTGIVDTPSDFGYMGGRPTHPQLLDFLAVQLKQNRWRIKQLHRLIMTSQTYRQSSEYRAGAAKIDADARLLWRFPPRRLSAEEIRDTMLMVSGKLNSVVFRSAETTSTTRIGRPQEADQEASIAARKATVPDGGPGFRLYHFMQDNVCTYVPLDKHGPETYRRAVYHQNARASVVDLMTEFDQPDCTFSAPRRAETTTPLQSMTMLNHSFTLDMARALADRLRREAGEDTGAQIQLAYQLCYSRQPTEDEINDCRGLAAAHGWIALCRVLLNTTEMIYVQ